MEARALAQERFGDTHSEQTLSKNLGKVGGKGRLGARVVAYGGVAYLRREQGAPSFLSPLASMRSVCRHHPPPLRSPSTIPPPHLSLRRVRHAQEWSKRFGRAAPLARLSRVPQHRSSSPPMYVCAGSYRSESTTSHHHTSGRPLVETQSFVCSTQARSCLSCLRACVAWCPRSLAGLRQGLLEHVEGAAGREVLFDRGPPRGARRAL